MKTLLIGLGGMGCELVARASKMLGKDSAAAFGLDTDYTDCKKKENTYGIPIFCMVSGATISDLIHGVSGNEDWFPQTLLLSAHESTSYESGPSRLIGRLAFDYFRLSKNDDKIYHIIDSLVADGREMGKLNVIIVSSFAGDTGSGIYIQTALLIRKYVREKYSIDCLIRGLFAMPDVFIRSCPSISYEERNIMYANAYAALKELSVINEVCLSDDPSAGDINIQIGDLFNSRQDRKMAEKKPFDSICLIDEINPRGMIMDSFENYLKMMSKCLFMMASCHKNTCEFFEPLVVHHVDYNDCGSTGCSAGASSIVYPYRDIVNYCGMRATLESFNDIWALIDRERKAAYENKERISLGISVKSFDRLEYFLTTVKSIIEEDGSRLNFIKKEITDISNDGGQIDRADAYYENVYKFIIDRIRNDGEIILKGNEICLTQEQLKNNPQGCATHTEKALQDYFDTINNRIVLLKDSLVQSVVPDEFELGINADSDWNITKLVKYNGNIVHPLAMRILLWEFRARVSEELNRCSAVAEATLKKINDYFKNAYDIKGTDVVESDIDCTVQGGPLKKLKFRREYLIKSAEQKARLDEYRDCKVVAVVYRDILRRLDAVINQVEGFFDSLDEIKERLQEKVDHIEQNMHSGHTNSVIYLCAAPEEKRDLYDSLHFSCSDSNDHDAFASIFNSLYEAGMKSSTKGHAGPVAAFENRTAVERSAEIFFNSVVKGNIADMEAKCADKLDIDVYQALSRYMNDNGGARMAIESAYDRAAPNLIYDLPLSFINETSEDEIKILHSLKIGINPAVEKRFQNESKKIFYSYIDYPSVLHSSTLFSRYELIFYRQIYGVPLSAISKLPEYEEAYIFEIEEYHKTKKAHHCPHIDKRWCEERVLPSII